MLAEVERVFSNIKIIINDKRQRLKAFIIEAIKCLKSWFRLNLFTQKNLNEIIKVDLDLDE